jgi:hypothetical protein
MQAVVLLIVPVAAQGQRSVGRPHGTQIGCIRKWHGRKVSRCKAMLMKLLMMRSLWHAPSFTAT